MAAIESVTIEATDPAAAEAFYLAAFDLAGRVRVRACDAPASGFRGFIMSLVVSQPATVRKLVDDATGAGATPLKPAAKSLWGYGGVVQAPDGTIWTIASSSKKDTGTASGKIDGIVLQLGVTDVAASRRFYADRGFTVAKSFGRKYVEFDTGPVSLTLNRRDALAKTASVPATGDGAHRLAIIGDDGRFTDPDGFAWETIAGAA